MNVKSIVIALGILTLSQYAFSSCTDNVVLVHGNAGSGSDWDNTYDRLINNGYSSSQIFRPNWGSSSPTNNDHSGSEETPVKNAINSAISSSCTGKIDVIGHSMGVTLAAQQIIKTNNVANVDAFVGIAGAYRGLYTCGIYPFNIANPTCGSNGLSISSPFLDWLFGQQIADRIYSIKSWADQIVCATGTCLVYGKHSSQIEGENASYTYVYGHFGLQQYTSLRQYNLIN